MARPTVLQLIAPTTDAPASITPDDFMDVAGVCRLIRVTRQDIYAAVHTGQLAVMRFGKKGKVWRFYKPDVLKLRQVLSQGREGRRIG